MAAAAITQPVDTVKTRVQLEGKIYNYSISKCTQFIVRNEGTAALWKGLSGPLMSMVFINGFVFMVEDITMEILNITRSQEWVDDNFVKSHMMAGGVAGFFQQ